MGDSFHLSLWFLLRNAFVNELNFKLLQIIVTSSALEVQNENLI